MIYDVTHYDVITLRYDVIALRYDVTCYDVITLRYDVTHCTVATVWLLDWMGSSLSQGITLIFCS